MFPVSAYDYEQPGDIVHVYDDIPNNVSYNVSYNHNESDYGKCRRHLFFQLSSAHVYVDCLTTIMKFIFHAQFVDTGMSKLEDLIFWILRQESRCYRSDFILVVFLFF